MDAMPSKTQTFVRYASYPLHNTILVGEGNGYTFLQDTGDVFLGTWSLKKKVGTGRVLSTGTGPYAGGRPTHQLTIEVNFD